jgi:hypothetical protein
VAAFAPTPQQAPDPATPAGPLVHHQRVEVQANTFTSNRQVDPALDADEQGNILVAWGSRRQEQGTFGIFAELLDAQGRALSVEMHVNQHVPREQAQPAVAMLPDGTAWISWHSVAQDGGEGVAVFARRFAIDADAATPGERFRPLGDEFRVQDHFAAQCRDAVLTANEAGEVLAAWTQTTMDGRQQLRGRLFSADGQPQGASFAIDTDAPAGASQRQPSVAGHGDGFLAVWNRLHESGSPDGLVGARIDRRRQAAPFAADAALPSVVCRSFPVVSSEHGFAIEASLDVAADGRFGVAWMSTQGGEYQAKARLFAADAAPRTAVLDIEAGGGTKRSGAQLAMAPDGRFLVAYNVKGAKLMTEPGHRPKTPVDIHARVFAADGSPLGEGFRLNGITEGEQNLQVGINARHLAWTARDQVVAAWHGETGQDGRGIGVTMLVPAGLEVPAPAPFAPVAAAQHLSEADVHADAARPIYNPFFVAGPYVPPPPAAGGIGGFEAIQNTGWTPPDPDLAVGPNHIVAVANGEISFFDKTGSQSFAQPIAGSGGFWGSVGAGGFVFDPIALYDPHTDRYIVAAADGAGSNDAICLAMSDDDDPNGTWYKYRFVISGTCGFYDFPNLGVSEDAIFLAGDCFAGGGNRVFFWDKSLVASGAAVSLQQIQTNNGQISLGASKNYDAGGTGYFATTYSSSSSRLMLKAITDPTGSPVLHEFELSVPSFAFPPDADQLGTSNDADTIDWRVKNGVVRNGSFWIAHNTGQSNTARVRWLEVDLNGWPTSGSNPTLAQSGTLDFGAGEHNWFPDINVTDDGTALIAFNRSSSSQYIGIEFVYRRAGDPAGTMRAPEELQRSTSPENGSRWGDYSGVEQDPVRPNVFWSHNEYRTSSWRTWVGEMSVQDEIGLGISAIQAGSSSLWTASAAQNGEVVNFLVSLNPGTFTPPQLGGLALDLGSPVTFVGNAVANTFGIATLNVNVPAGAPVGSTAYVQAAIIRGVGGIDSVKSNLVTEVIQ